MTRLLLAGLVLVPALSTGACQKTTATQTQPPAAAAVPSPVAANPAPPRRRAAQGPRPEQPAPPNTSASSWQMPFQIAPITTASAAAGEPIILSYVPQTGFVRGTPKALAGLGRPLEAAPGRNRTVNACRAAVIGEATKVGAREIEAVSAGAETKARNGTYFAPVHVRVTYARPDGLEVRESTLTCIVDAKEKIVDAYT